MSRVLCSLLTLVSLVSGRDPPLISIPNQGLIIGREVAVSRFQRSAAFLGIPFAAPPVDSLRFEPPEPYPTWNNTYNGTFFRPACLQTEKYWRRTHPLFEVLGFEMPEFDEDCLYLNVFLPEWNSGPSVELLPVLVWIHPGDFQAGAASPWDGTFLANKNKVIVVTISYRLNVFGFLNIKSDSESTNLGLQDQTAALVWVQQKIESFGGNKNQVTIFGQGAGGISVGLHLSSNSPPDLFIRAIAMGGNALISGAISPQKPVDEMANLLGVNFGCAEGSLLQCLRIPKPKTLLNEAMLLGTWNPVVDAALVSDAFLPDTPSKRFDDNQFNKVELMLGYNDMNSISNRSQIEELENDISLEEFKQEIKLMVEKELQRELAEAESNYSCILFNEHVIDTVLFFYSPYPTTNDPAILRQKLIDFRTEMRYAASTLRQADYFSLHKPTYVYRFDYKAKKLGLSESTTVTDQFELPYIWGMPYWPNMTFWSSNDKKFSDTVMSLWTNFARTGNASTSAVRWDRYSTGNPAILKLDKNFNISDTSTLDYQAFSFWNEYFPQVQEAFQECCNTTSAASSLIAVNKYNFIVIYLVSFVILYSSVVSFIRYFYYTSVIIQKKQFRFTNLISDFKTH